MLTTAFLAVGLGVVICVPQCLKCVLLTATNFATIVHSNKSIKGETKYQTLDELFQKKTGQGKPFTSAPAMDHGVFFESEAARVYTMVTGIELIIDCLHSHQSRNSCYDGIRIDLILM